MLFLASNPSPKVIEEINRSNLARINNMAIVIMIVEVFMLILSFVFNTSNMYKYFYMFLFIVAVITYQLSRDKYRQKMSSNKLLLYFISYMFSFWGIAISLIDYHSGIAAFVYLINISIIISFLVYSPKEILLYNLINMIVFFLIFYLYGSLDFALVVNVLTFHCMLFLIGIDRYRYVSQNIVVKSNLFEANQELRILSTIDQLSGCKNRRGFLYEFEKYKGQVVFALLTDIDNFKNINDQYGHDIGDLFIINFAKILQSNFGVNNVFRIGGDEFFIISNSDPLDVCLKKFKTSCKEVGDISFVAGSDLKMTASSGYTYKVLDEDSDYLSIYKLLDVALYKAKHAGKNKIMKALE
jgi:diguanylate cyclase (GGDEF)-like protein